MLKSDILQAFSLAALMSLFIVFPRIFQILSSQAFAAVIMYEPSYVTKKIPSFVTRRKLVHHLNLKISI